MGVVLSVYTEAAFKEYILPSINNSDYEITLQGDYFQLQEDLELRLEILNGEWYFRKGSGYYIIKNNMQYERQPLQDKDVLMVHSLFKDEISVIVKKIESVFHVYKKFVMHGANMITIGKDTQNDICYDYLGMVSRNHAKIIRESNGYRIENSSPNGVYVNSQQVNDSAELTFGAFINIMGLHIVFLDNILAIDVSENIVINKNILMPYVFDRDVTMLLNADNRASVGRTMYHRAPRNYEKLDSDRIEIEAPPQKYQTKKQPLFMTIGPSLTMALPMLLGCMMMIYSNSASGGRSSLYMYSGLVMSVASAGVGVLWTLFNMKYQKKEEKAQEEYRFQAYSEYLIEKTNEVKERYSETERRLEETYPSASVCLNYDESRGILWNRNHTHDDFLKHRLGVGELPFQFEMEIPKKQFTLYHDELSEKPAFIKKNYETLYNVPITVDLLEKNLIGIVGGDKKKKAIDVAKLLSVQIASNNCYTDVKLGYIYDNASSADYRRFDFAKWFPHVWSEDRQTRYVASSREDASEVFYELTKIFRGREEGEETYQREGVIKPYYVIFISDISMLEGELFTKYALSKEPQYGLTTILLTDRYEELPNDCEYIIENTDNFCGMYDVFEGKENRQKIVYDEADDSELEHFARHLSSLHVAELEEGGEIPNSITFFEMLGVNRIEEYPVAEMWAKCRTYENIKGLLGQRGGGSDCYLDVHEKYHGPHGLVAGTTGSGKSETLQTYILSLAVNYSPDDVGFFIIDYKGGGMANLFEGLPHMIGQISNLSGNQVKRAMISIKSENRRRQRVFTENGVNNINLYTKLYKNGEARTPIPHLFIIIDEFAELKREEPDFMRELISVAQVGRSLGVHLILATQKPSGTVDDNIWSNSKFRICLRVQDQQDSKDMLHKPDAAYITQAGRGYLQVGNDEVYEMFQSGFSGAVFDENMVSGAKEIAKLITMPGKVDMTGNSVKLSQKQKAEAIWIETLCKCMGMVIKNNKEVIQNCKDPMSKMILLVDGMYMTLEKIHMDYPESEYNTARLRDFVTIYMEAIRKKPQTSLPEEIITLSLARGKKLPQAKEKTQLDVTKEYLALVAKENGYHHDIQLWMPLLKEQIYLEEFREFMSSCFAKGKWKVPSEEWSLEIVIGQMDDPENQNQMPLAIDFAEQGHIAVIGNIVSGKSTMLQTMAYALIQKFSPDYVSIYALDFSSKMMSAFEEAPHVGGVMYEGDNEKIGKFFSMLNNMLEERKVLFRGGNYRQYIQLNGVKLPAIIIMIDNYASFKEKTEGIYDDQVIQISKEGINLGIFLVVTGAGFGYNDITNRVGENIETVLCLALQDKYAYGDFLHNMQIDVLPEGGIKGRGLAYYGSRILEYQTALAIEAENNYQRMEKIGDVCKQMKKSWAGRTARRIPEIPEKPTWSLLVQTDGYKDLLEKKDFVPVGYDMENADIYGIPLSQIYCYLVCGASRTGKTNFMKVFIQSVLEKRSEVCIIDSPKKELKAYRKNEKVTYISNEEQIFEYFRGTLTPVFQSRNKVKNQMLNDDFEEAEIYEAMSEKKPHFIFIADMPSFVKLIYSAKLDMKGFLETLIARGRLHNIYFIAELALNKISEVRGYQVFESFAEYRMGIHFGGKVMDNSLLSFEYMPYKEQAVVDKAGTGTLSNVTEQFRTQKVVVPLARK